MQNDGNYSKNGEPRHNPQNTSDMPRGYGGNPENMRRDININTIQNSNPNTSRARTQFSRPNGNSRQFGQTGETDLIRQNEMLARERRAKHAEVLRRKERIKRAKIKKIKRLVRGWAIILGFAAVVIAVIAVLVSAFKKITKKPDLYPNIVDQSILTAYDEFSSSGKIIYSSDENTLLSAADCLINDFALSKNPSLSLPVSSSDPSTFLWQAKRYAWYSDKTYINELKQILRDYPIFSNGYIWSSESSMKSEKNGFYLYDTNSRFISAVCEITLWEADTSFLYEKDTTSAPKLDVSNGLTVLEKLEKAVNYYFDKNDLNGGGIRYNEADGLVYILTESNSGESNGAGSNYWFNHRFGYLDAYCNIAFNEAMNDLAKLYTLMGQPEKADEYSAVAEKNKTAINQTFFRESSLRYAGAKDASGSYHDLGFTFLNLEAISSGIADKKTSDAILSWIDGKTEVTSDTSTGADIYAFGFAPRSNTINASDSWWDYVNGNFPLSSTAAFGKYWQNGGASLVTEYYDLAARAKVSKKSFLNRFTDFAACYTDGKLLISSPETLSVNGYAECGAAASMAVYGLFGADTDGSVLTADPNLGEYTGYAGIKNIGFGTNSYGFLFGAENVIVTASCSDAVRLKIGGFEKGKNYTARIVSDGLYISEEPCTADEKGFLNLSERFGESSFLVIFPTPEENGKK